MKFSDHSNSLFRLTAWGNIVKETPHLISQNAQQRKKELLINPFTWTGSDTRSVFKLYLIDWIQSFPSILAALLELKNQVCPTIYTLMKGE